MKNIFGLIFAILTFGLAQSVAAQEVVTDEMLANADLNKGKRVFLRCAACHTLGEGERNKVGPNLWHIFGRKAGTKEGQHYSKAMEAADFTWGPDKLNAWLTKPRAFLPGTSMSFPGLAKEEQRIDVIAYVRSKTGYEAPGDDDNDEAGGAKDSQEENGADGSE